MKLKSQNGKRIMAGVPGTGALEINGGRNKESNQTR